MTRTFPHTASALAFPLGGIGTGNVSLGARGEFRDWEIWNRPNKGYALPNTFFALRAQAEGQLAITKVLEAPIQPPHAESHGYHPHSAAGLPRLDGAVFTGEYPIARVAFEDAQLPVAIELEAFTPFIPLDPDDSGLPCAILTYTLTNRTGGEVDLTLVGSLINPVGGIAQDVYGGLARGTEGAAGRSMNDFREEGNVRGLSLHTDQFARDNLRFGDVSLITTHPDVTYKRAWLRSGWYDWLREFWTDLAEDGRLNDLGYAEPSQSGRPDTGSLGIVDRLVPGESRRYTFILTWFFPNRRNHWDDKPERLIVRNHYAVRFDSSWEVARYVADNFERLSTTTHQFRDALFGSTLPPAVIDAVSANIVPLRSNTCFWLEDGRFFGWEGCFDHAGCCAGSCTHVWSYAYTLAYVFPSLEREIRRIEFEVETRDSGFMHFRSYQTMDVVVWNEDMQAAADGQMGSILRAYREWLLSGDREWLSAIWPGIKRAIQYADAHWDTDQDGVPDGRQHNTYDIEFYGPNPLTGIYYLAGLRATEELAQVMNEPEFAARCRATFELGKQRLDELLWNGEYFVQRLPDVDAHRYQHGEGCLSDQLLGQTHAHLLGLGDVLREGRAKSAIKAVYDHNFKRSFRDHVNAQRVYVLNDEAGLILCSWPNGGEPRFPFPYSDEAWTGIEYHVAAQLMCDGWLNEGLEIVKAARNRHDGVRRNPWNEVECGHHYARSMSSWMLLLALSGFHCNADKGEMDFDPILTASTQPDEFTAFWCNGKAWGTFTLRRDPATDTWARSLQVLGKAPEVHL